MRVLVVAATGFVGGHIARRFLDAGHRVTALVRDHTRAAADPRLAGASLIVGRVGDLPGLERHDVVVYAAGAWVRDDVSSEAAIAQRCREVYIDGVSALARSAREWGAHFVFLSGTSRYGDREGVLREETEPGALSVYGAHKRQSEAILASTDGLRWTAIVPPEIYGAHDAGGYVRFVYERVRARRLIILGSGANRWSLCNVRNVADAVFSASTGEGLGVLHIADTTPTSQLELATEIARALGRRPIFPRVPRALAIPLATINALRPGSRLGPTHVRVRTRDAILDTSRATRLGFVSLHSLAEGIREAVDFWHRRATV